MRLLVACKRGHSNWEPLPRHPHRKRCRTCRTIRHLESRHGPGAFEHLLRQLRKQTGRCGICRCAIVNELVGMGRSRTTAHLDHCHVSGSLRGALCSQCNLALGGFKDDVRILRKAVMYLIEWGHGRKN